MNKYLRAISRGEVNEFLLGKGKYFEHHDKDMNYPDHDVSKSFNYLLEYADDYGYDKMTKELDKSLIEVITTDISPFDLSSLMQYIYIYINRSVIEKTIRYKWNLSENLKQTIKNKLNEFRNKYGSNNNRSSTDVKRDNPYNVNNVEFMIQLIKDRYEIDFLDYYK
ncbi:MAG: hypothetical protein BGO86_03520 [Chryseobacterium sp. 36-9]|nr:MAG: hypothetical protein BGO86_03520 [Chryseobacterium sp. 36-9]